MRDAAIANYLAVAKKGPCHTQKLSFADWKILAVFNYRSGQLFGQHFYFVFHACLFQGFPYGDVWIFVERVQIVPLKKPKRYDQTGLSQLHCNNYRLPYSADEKNRVLWNDRQPGTQVFQANFTYVNSVDFYVPWREFYQREQTPAQRALSRSRSSDNSYAWLNHSWKH